MTSTEWKERLQKAMEKHRSMSRRDNEELWRRNFKNKTKGLPHLLNEKPLPWRLQLNSERSDACQNIRHFIEELRAQEERPYWTRKAKPAAFRLWHEESEEEWKPVSSFCTWSDLPGWDDFPPRGPRPGRDVANRILYGKPKLKRKLFFE